MRERECVCVYGSLSEAKDQTKEGIHLVVGVEVGRYPLCKRVWPKMKRQDSIVNVIVYYYCLDTKCFV